MMRTRLSIALVVLPALLVACGKTETPPSRPSPAVATPVAPQAAAPTPLAPFQVLRIDLGKAVGADKKVTEPVASFAPGDTIFASVLADGASPRVTLKARWTFGDDGQVVSESSQTIAPLGPSATEFHISRPSGWPAGKYKVEISIDGKTVASRDFDVAG